jgi:hypothetical protein
MHAIIVYIKLQIAELIEGTETTLQVIQKLIIQEGLLKHREEATIGLNH